MPVNVTNKGNRGQSSICWLLGLPGRPGQTRHPVAGDVFMVRGPFLTTDTPVMVPATVSGNPPIAIYTILATYLCPPPCMKRYHLAVS